MDNPIYRTMAWKKVRVLVLERDGHECQIRLPGCKGRARSVDHIVALEDGGELYEPSNLQACCVPCNSAKGLHDLHRRASGQVRSW